MPTKRSPIPSDEVVRWLEEMTEASAKKRSSDLWQLAAAYRIQEMVRDGHELMKIPFFEWVFTTVAERFERVLEEAKTNHALAMALCRARAALRDPGFFADPNITIRALEEYWELRYELGRPPGDDEIMAELAVHTRTERSQRL